MQILLRAIEQLVTLRFWMLHHVIATRRKYVFNLKRQES